MNKNFNPLVSIIIPVYNGSNYMREAIDSAIAQTYKNVEIVVVNDGSTDDTDNIAKSYGDKIRYYKKENGGVATALNLAIKKSKGEYISWLSHDDIYYVDKIEKQINKLASLGNNERKESIVWSNYSLINEKSEITSTQSFEVTHQVDKLNYSPYPLLKGIIHGCTLLIPKKCFDKVGLFDANLKTTQDYDLWIKMFPQYSLIFMQDLLVKSRWHDEQGSKTIGETAGEASELWIKMIESLSNDEKIFIDGSVIEFYEKILTIMLEAKYTRAANYAEDKIAEYKNREISEVKVSVIIPFYNRIEWMIEAIESVINQTHKNLEIIVVNDKSTEDIIKIKNISEEDDRIKFIDNQKTKGVSGARNTGIDIATGEFISFLDSDDLFLSEKIERQLTFMVRNGHLFSHASYLLFDNNTDNVQIINSGNVDYVFPNIIAGCAIATPTVMIFRDLLRSKNLKFPELFFGGEDTCFWIDISKEKSCIGFDEVLVRVRNHGENFAHNDLKQVQGLSNVLSYVSAKYLNANTAQYVFQLDEKITHNLNKLKIHSEKKTASTNHNRLSNKLVLKNKIRKILYKFIWTVSPSFRMQVGNKHRLNQLLSKVKNLESSIDNKVKNLENSINRIEDLIKSDDFDDLQRIKILFQSKGKLGTGNDGERLVPGYSNNKDEFIRHRSTYVFFKKIIDGDLVNKSSLITKGIKILELGSGVGHGSKFLAEIPNVHITAIEIDDDAWKYSRNNYFSKNIDYINDSIENFLNNNTEEFDYVVSRHALEHVDMNLKNIVEKLYFSKRAMLSVPYKEKPGNPYHKHLMIDENSFGNNNHKEFFYEDVEGMTDLKVFSNKKTNSFTCVVNKSGMESVSEMMEFPIKKAEIMGLEKDFLELFPIDE